MNSGIHAGGADDYQKEVGARLAGSRQRLEIRFYRLVVRLCRRRGILGGIRISLAWRRVAKKRLPEEDTTGALWVKA